MPQLDRSRHTAQHPDTLERVRLLSPIALAGAVLAVAAALVLVFPGEGLVLRLVRQHTPDQVTLAYVNAVARAAPGDVEWQLLLAEQQAGVGQLALAAATLERLRHEIPANKTTRLDWLEFHITAQTALAAAIGTESHRLNRQRALSLAHTLVDRPLDSAKLKVIAPLCAALGAPELAAKFFDRMVAVEPGKAAYWLGKAASAAFTGGDFSGAARYYFAAQAASTDTALQRKYFRSGVDTLRAANKPREALAAAERHLKGLTLDDETLLYLIQVAEQANDMAAAQRFVRMLLQLKQHSSALSTQGWIDYLFTPAYAVTGDEVALRPFDERIYTRSFKVFLAGGSINDAYRVARAAVTARPDDMTWRKRLAETAEWSNRPHEALTQWAVLAHRTNSRKAWDQVLRLAPALDRPDLVAQAWDYRAHNEALSHEQWQALINAYESIGQPERAIVLLRRAYHRKHEPFYLQQVARLYNRAGDLNAATKAYQELLDTQQGTSKTVIAYATLLLVRNRIHEAYQVLDRYRDRADRTANEYWELLGDLAWQLGKNSTAEYAYRELYLSSKGDIEDYRRLALLLQRHYPEQSAQVAARAAKLFHAPQMLAFGLSLLLDKPDLVAARRLLYGLDLETMEAGEHNEQFLSQRARFWLLSGRCEESGQDYRAALALQPTSTDVAEDYLWSRLDCGDTRMLSQWLPRIRAGNRSRGQYAALLPAIYLTLGEPRRALPLLARQASSHQNDTGWLLNYADALEQSGRKADAARVRQHVTSVLKQHEADSGAGDGATHPWLLAYANLSLRLNPGDKSRHALRMLLRQDLRNGVNSSGEARALALAWSVSAGETEASRYWLWRGTAHWLLAQRWATLDTALREGDREAMAHALDGDGAMTPGQRAEAEQRLGQLAEAQSTLFKALRRPRWDNELHQPYTEAALDNSGNLGLLLRRYQIGVLSGIEHRVSARWWMGPRSSLEPYYDWREQRSTDSQQLVNPPTWDREKGLGYDYRISSGRLVFKYMQREAISRIDGWRVGIEQSDRGDWHWGANFERNARADETSLLAVGGLRDRLALHGEYAFDRRTYLSTQLWRSEYTLQSPRQSLGDGAGITAEAGYYARLNYPELVVRITGDSQRYNKASSMGLASNLLPAGSNVVQAFMPRDYDELGINVGIGESARDTYRRAWRGFATAGVSSNSTTGLGYNLAIGVGGSVSGEDYLTLAGEWARGGTDTTGDTAWSAWLRYRYFIGRP